jgi:hypothetical protein
MVFHVMMASMLSAKRSYEHRKSSAGVWRILKSYLVTEKIATWKSDPKTILKEDDDGPAHCLIKLLENRDATQLELKAASLKLGQLLCYHAMLQGRVDPPEENN